VGLDLRLVRLTGDKGEVGKGRIWISCDRRRIPLLFIASHVLGTIRVEMVQMLY
jgi:hypothetical protein